MAHIKLPYIFLKLSVLEIIIYNRKLQDQIVIRGEDEAVPVEPLQVPGRQIRGWVDHFLMNFTHKTTKAK